MMLKLSIMFTSTEETIVTSIESSKKPSILSMSGVKISQLKKRSAKNSIPPSVMIKRRTTAREAVSLSTFLLSIDEHYTSFVNLEQK